MGTIYHSTTNHGINIQYYLWLALYIHNTVVFGIQEVYTELGFKYLNTFWKLRNRISAGTVKTMEALGAYYSVNGGWLPSKCKGTTGTRSSFHTYYIVEALPLCRKDETYTVL